MGSAFSLDSKKSNPSLKSSWAAGEDGRIRRSYDEAGISNRGVSNLERQ